MVSSLKLANTLNRHLDRGIFELLGPLGIFKLVHSYSNSVLMLFSPRSIYHYLTYALVWCIIIGLYSI
jgi:hypothetical protein